jgi:hypothetical protein
MSATLARARVNAKPDLRDEEMPNLLSTKPGSEYDVTILMRKAKVLKSFKKTQEKITLLC